MLRLLSGFEDALFFLLDGYLNVRDCLQRNYFVNELTRANLRLQSTTKKQR